VIQVLQFTASAAIGVGEPIVVYEGKDRLMVGYAECYRGGRLVQDEDESEDMLTTLNLIRTCALSPHESVAWMRTLRSNLASE
jgi:hypothetical protein